VDFYNSWMAAPAVEARGIEPLKKDIDAINGARTKAEIVKLMGNIDYGGPIGIYILPDPADPTKYTVGVTQSGLGMPSRDYYLNKGDKFDSYRSAYKTYVTKILQLSGDTAPPASADAIIALETKLAKIHWEPERQRDVKATNNPVDRAGLKKMIPAVDWDSMLPVANLGDVQHFVVNETTALRDGTKLLDTEPVDTWKRYLIFHLASDYAAYLPKAFDDASFDFFSKSLRGIEVKRDRWKRGVRLLDAQIGEGLGEMYVAKYFPPENKAKMDQLVANLRTAMGERLKRSHGWTMRPARRLRRNSRPSSHASAIRRNGATTRPFPSMPRNSSKMFATRKNSTGIDGSPGSISRSIEPSGA